MQKFTKILSMAIIAAGVVACNSGGSSTPSSGWKWIGGSNQVNLPNNYQESTALPSGRDVSVSWIDSAGNLWLFGGQGYGQNSSESGLLNDLWKYNPTTKQWQLIGGQSSINTAGVYGSKGVAAANNYPGGRIGAVSWTDSAGNLWMFGGFGYASNAQIPGALNDLWQFNPTTNQWTWMSGQDIIDSSGIYTVKDIADSLSHPGARLGSIGWIDSTGDLWLFGGANSLSTLNDYNDLWKYNPTSNQWTWISGESTLDSNGFYGIQGVPNLRNEPSARLDSVSWLDESGNLWLFGGSGQDGVNTPLIGQLNDLWRYNPTTHLWTWMSGANTSNKYGVYGKQGISSPNSIPGSRMHRNPFAWVDASGTFWMFGGDGYGADSQGILNDLWSYNPTTNQWTWVNGGTQSNVIGNYGTQGAFSNSNQPGARRDGTGWVQSDGSIVLFGGFGYNATESGLLNDLWLFKL